MRFIRRRRDLPAFRVVGLPAEGAIYPQLNTFTRRLCGG